MAESVRMLFAPFAEWVLKPQMAEFWDRHAALQHAYTHASSEVRYVRKCQAELAEWLHDQTDTWADRKEILFIRDYFLQGPKGPAANSAGVHPADRWQINSFKRR